MEGTYIPPGALGKVWRIYQGVISMITLAGAIMSAVFLGAMFINVIMRYCFIFSHDFLFEGYVIGTEMSDFG